MEIRYYKDKDFSQLEQLLKKVDLYYEPLDNRGILKKQIDYDSESIIVAEYREKIIGTVFLLYNPWASFIYHLCVDPDYQRRGIGTKLMDKAEEVLRNRGTEIPTLFVESTNKKAIDFYKKRGWKAFPVALPMEKKIYEKII